MRHHIIIIVLALMLVSCTSASTPASVTPSITPTSTATPTPPPPTATAAPTPIPQHLTLCATEPFAASPFVPTQSGSDLLALFFEEPSERVGYQWEPRLIERIPSPENGDVITQAVTIREGTRYVDIDGGIKTYQNDDPIDMPQLVVTFTLKADLLWSNGQPLTAEDFILGYHLAQSAETRGRWRTLLERTERFNVLSERELQWKGIPGFISTNYPGFLFPPQPAHRWREQSMDQILRDRTPPATGPFQIVAWEAGREVRLEPNPHYVGKAPRLESLTFRFPQIQGTSWDQLLLLGECDVLLPDPIAATDWQQWSRLSDQGTAMIWADPAPVILRLDFNLQPQDQAPSAITDLQTRLGLAYCIDRQRLSESLPGEALIPADSFVPLGHPAFDIDQITRFPYNPEIGQALLDESGWRDEDDDGIREAYDIEGFTDGEPLSLTLHLAPQYFVTAAHIAADLEACGVDVEPLLTEKQLLYATDKVSPLFGRTFQMALFGWTADVPKICGSWHSDRIPNEDNAWIGENFSGYVSEAYDAACQHALTTIDVTEQASALKLAQAMLTSDLPTVFLTWRPFWFVANPRVQGLQPDASTYGTIWNIEDIFISE